MISRVSEFVLLEMLGEQLHNAIAQARGCCNDVGGDSGGCVEQQKCRAERIVSWSVMLLWCKGIRSRGYDSSTKRQRLVRRQCVCRMC